MATARDRSVQLLVVGAGPVGMFAALEAARAGLEVEVIDQTFRGWGRGYATLLHPRSVGLLADAGVGHRLREVGRPVRTVRLRADDQDPVELALSSPALAVPQAVLEEELLTALREANVELLAPFQATTLRQSAANVEVRLVRRELARHGSPADYSEWEPVESSQVTADFVLGADGYESRIRSALGIEAAELGRTETFAMFEAPVEEDPGERMELVLAGSLASAVVPLTGGRARLGFQIDQGLDVLPDLARLKGLARERIPFYPDGASRVDWGSVIQFERRLVRRFGSGRVWLAGDAAHVTSPFGAQSMNNGLFEAHDFIERIVACVSHGSNVGLLEGYGARHQREWHKLLGFHVKYDLLPDAPPWLGTHARRLGAMLPASGDELRRALHELGLAVS